MKLRTVIDLIASGQLSLLLGLGGPIRQFYRSTFIAAALSEGLYSFLLAGPASLDQIHERLIGPPSPAELPREKLKAWLDLGITLGELKLTPAGYALNSRLSRQLAQPSNDGVAALFEEVCTLHHTLITETPARLREKRLFAPAESDGRLIARSSRILEPYIFEVVDSVIPESGAYHVLEVGCGSGVYIRRACLRNPDLQAVGVELQPDVADFARQNLQDWGLAERVRVETGDIRGYVSPECFDLVTLHNNIYYFPVHERLDLIRRLANFLNPGGKIVVTTACQGSQSTQVLNLWGEMSAGTGPLPQPDSLGDLLTQAGFTSPQKTRLLPGENFYAFVSSKN